MDPIPHAAPKIVGRHYRIESRVGIGGMGVVYRATDTNLNRPVAVKAIHDTRYQDRDGRNRLREEAVAAASIDHPYICKVYELIEDAGEAYLVMEFVEGETLSSMLRRGMPTLTQTVQIMSEVVEGLATAHARGLVHRDVKPSNVMITKNGHVKLLDFGLAREDVISTPADRTRTSPSDASAYAGTPQYMSPEQAEGLPVTARADLFSVGVLLFECLTGKLPFSGSSAYDYVRHLLSDNPRRLDRLAPDAPADLVHLVDQCLEKSPSDRPESANAVLDELRRIAGSLTATGASFNTARDVRAKRRWQFTAAAIGLAAVALVTWQWLLGGPPADPLRRSRSIVTWPSEESDSRVSPDSRWISFISDRDGLRQLYVLPVNGTEARVVALPSGRIESHAWSPDGDQFVVAIRRPDGIALQVVPAFFGGASVQSVPMAGTSVNVLRWIDRRVFLATSGNTTRSLQAVNLDTGTLTDLSAEWTVAGRLLALDVRPDGGAVVLSVLSEGREDLWTTPLDEWTPKRLTDDEFYARGPMWSSTGESVIYSTNRGGQDDLWELIVSSGRHRALTSSQTEERIASASPDGRLVTFEQNSDDARLWFLDPSVPTSRQLTADALSDIAPALSGDARRIVFQRTQPSPAQGYQILDSQLFTADLSGSSFGTEPRVVTDGFAGTLSPDGMRLAYFQTGDAPGQTVLRIRLLDTDDTIVVTPSSRLQILRPFPVDWAERLVAWSQDSSAVYVVERSTQDAIRRYKVGQSEADQDVELFTAEAGAYIRDLYVSPDGARLSFLVSLPGAFDVHVLDLETGRDRAIARVSGSFPGVFGRGWLADGRVVVVRADVVHEDRSVDVAILTISPTGSVDTAGVVSHAYESSARLDAARQVVYITGIERGVHNLYSFAIGSGSRTRITNNALQGVTFSGIAPVASGGLIVVQSQRKRDIWVIETVADDTNR